MQPSPPRGQQHRHGNSGNGRGERSNVMNLPSSYQSQEYPEYPEYPERESRSVLEAEAVSSDLVAQLQVRVFGVGGVIERV